MADEQGKQLKISIAVDNAALEQFKRAIREVTAEVSKLVETLNRAGGALGGAGGGFVRSSARGGFSAATGTTAGAQKPIGGAIATPVEQIAASLRGTARGSVDALRQMESATRSFTERSSQNLRQFERALDSLAGKYKNLSGAANGVMLPGGGGFMEGGGPLPRGADESFAPNGIVNKGGIDYAAGPPGRMSRAWKFMNRPIFGAGGIFSRGGGGGGGGDEGGGEEEGGGKGRKGIFNALRQGASALGLPSFAGGVAGGVGAAVAGYQFVNQTMVGRDKFLANEAISSQFDMLNRRSQINQTLGNMGQKLRYDMATQRAMSKVTPNDLRAALGPETFNALVTKAYQESGNTGNLKEVGKGVTDRAGKWFNGMFGNNALENGATGGSIGQSAEQRAVLERMLGNIPADQIGKLSEAIQKRGETLSVRDQSIIGQFQGSALGRMGLMRQAGVGERQVRLPTGQMITVNGAELLGQGTNFTSEEVAGMRANLGATAGRGLMGGFGRFGASSLLSMQAGGLGNAAQIGGIGAQYGNGAGLIGALQGGIGRGGLDVTAGGQIGGLVSGAMTQGNNSIGGSEAMAGLLSAASTGGAGGDMRMARIMGAGLEGRNAQLGGQTDQLQSAINVLAANKAAPGLSVYGKHALQGVGSAQMIEMLRSGKVSPELADMGINIDQLRKYASTQSSFAFSRFIGGTGQGGAMEQAAIGARGAGGAKEYIGGLLSAQHLKAGSRAGRNLIQSQARLLGEALKATGQAGTNEQGMAMIMAELAEDKSLLPALKGHGAHDVAGKTLEAASKRGDDVVKKDTEERTGQLRGDIQALAATRGAAGKAADVMDAQGASVNVNMKALNGALSEFTAAIAEATRNIKNGTPSVKPR